MSLNNPTSLECSTHTPLHSTGEGLALTHGAGGDCHSALLIAIAEAFCEAGFTVLRFNLAYRQSRPSGPPLPAGAQKDRESIRAALATLRPMVTGPLYLAGQSYGGRQASILATEDSTCALALVLLSYPLHPPGKPNQLRTEHFANLQTPTLFVHGPRDPFATEAELDAARQLIPATTAVHSVPKAGHELLRGRFPIAPMISALRELAK